MNNYYSSINSKQLYDIVDKMEYGDKTISDLITNIIATATLTDYQIRFMKDTSDIKKVVVYIEKNNTTYYMIIFNYLPPHI